MDRVSPVKISLLLISLSLWACPAPPPVVAPDRHCTPACKAEGTCGKLPARLIQARKRFLDCVGEEAQRGHVSAAHRCYRALRLLESARWWTQTLMTPELQLTVYQPAEVIRDEFLCCIERLCQARTPDQVERLYLELVKNYP